MIPSDRWTHTKALFSAALDRAPDERAAFLAAACPDDAPLRHEVEALLSADARAGSFIETPAGSTMASLRPGDCLGPYEIVDFIGAGGMGEVYKARDTRLGRHVAVK